MNCCNEYGDCEQGRHTARYANSDSLTALKKPSQPCFMLAL